ncbi:MAG: ComEC/Rec2 family competence protein [Parabacteroides merdae]
MKKICTGHYYCRLPASYEPGGAEPFFGYGVAHILAVSGFHVAIVCGFLSFLFSFLPRNGCCRWIRYISLLVLLWGFAAITGLAVSSVRAALMLTMYLTGGVLDRRAERYNILAASAFCMLVYEPLYLFDIGFQLSYLAVLSILYFQPRLQALIKVHNPFLRTPWGGSRLLCRHRRARLFYVCIISGSFRLSFLLTNLPLTFLATFVDTGKFGFYMFLPEYGFLEYGWLQVGVEWLAHDLLWVVDAFSQVPGAVFSFRFDFPAMLVAYGMLLSILLYGHTGRSRYLLVILFLLLIILLVRVIEDLKQCGI